MRGINNNQLPLHSISCVEPNLQMALQDYLFVLKTEIHKN